MSISIGGKWLDDLNQDLSGSERSTAVLAGAIVDDRLKTLIGRHLKPPRVKGDELLGRSKPLESLASRISLANRLGLISDGSAKALDWIRDIRNQAAHDQDFTFENQSINDKVTNIMDALELKEKAPSLLTGPYDSPRGHFVAATVMLVSVLELEIDGVETVARVPLDFVSNIKEINDGS